MKLLLRATCQFTGFASPILISVGPLVGVKRLRTKIKPTPGFGLLRPTNAMIRTTARVPTAFIETRSHRAVGAAPQPRRALNEPPPSFGAAQPRLVVCVKSNSHVGSECSASLYQRHECREERRWAIIAWGAHVIGIVFADKSPSNVVRFAASR